MPDGHMRQHEPASSGQALSDLPLSPSQVWSAVQFAAACVHDRRAPWAAVSSWGFRGGPGSSRGRERGIHFCVVLLPRKRYLVFSMNANRGV